MNFRPRQSESSEPAIDIAPLIDVVFLLLIFFLLTTTFAAHPILDVTLPSSHQKAPTKPNKDQVVVNVTKDGHILQAGKQVSDAALAKVFRDAAKAHPDTVVLLQADRDSTHGRVVQVMDMARMAGLTKLAIVTQAPVGSGK